MEVFLPAIRTIRSLSARCRSSQERTGKELLLSMTHSWVRVLLTIVCCFFSSSEGEASIPEFQQNEEDIQRTVVPFEYTIDSSCIKIKPIPAGSDPWYTYSIRECLSGTWLLKELSANKMTFYRFPESEVVVTLNKVEL